MSFQTRTTALQNEIVRLYCTFKRDGVLTNPAAQPLVEIIDTDGVTVLGTVQAQIDHTGIWYADYYCPATLPLGDYYDRWTFQWGASGEVCELIFTFSVHGLESYINFISPNISHSISDRVAGLMNDFTNEFIYEAQHIPVYFEQGMRIQQEDQSKRVKKYYYFTLDTNNYNVFVGDVYFNNGNRFTVEQTVYPIYSSSSSESSSSESISDSSSSSSSLESYSSESSQSESSTSSTSMSSVSVTSSSYEVPTTTTTTTTPWVYQQVLFCVGSGNPTPSGILTKISGQGPSQVGFISVESKTSKFSTIYTLAYQNWNKDPRPIVKINNRIVDDGWFTDFNGKLYIDGLMAPEDSVNVFYKFSYFSEAEILSFLNLGLQVMNSTPPASIYYGQLQSMPGEWNAPVLLYAAVVALKRLIFGLNFQEKRIVFGDPEEARNAISTFQQLYQEYNTTWQEVSKDAKTRKLYGMSQSVTPEYSLPGGRCLASDTIIKCLVNSAKKELTIKDMFCLFEAGNDIRVLSLIDDNEIDYSPISKIWESGQKLTCILKTKDAQIRLTKEHLVYLPEEKCYKPVMDITKQDKIYVLKDKKLVKQKLLSDPKEYKVEEVYDIEVPKTENFIGNNVVSHNSRFFRYMYK